jgi:pimeloyl-ACP methyl ester carboxylesterase
VPYATNGDVALFYDTHGEDAVSDGTVVFVSDVGYGAWQWGWHVDAVAGERRTLTWDLRGTGRSDAPPGPYTVNALAADLEAVLADAGVATAHLVGHGLGGMVALRHARRHGRAVALALCGIAADGDAVDADALDGLRGDGRDALEGAFSSAFLADGPVEQVVAWREEDDAGPEAWEAQAAAMRSFEAGPLYEVTLPALVFHGVDDPVVPPEAGESLATDLPRGRHEAVAGRHLAAVEHARATADELLAFLDAEA